MFHVRSIDQAQKQAVILKYLWTNNQSTFGSQSVMLACFCVINSFTFIYGSYFVQYGGFLGLTHDIIDQNVNDDSFRVNNEF